MTCTGSPPWNEPADPRGTVCGQRRREARRRPSLRGTRPDASPLTAGRRPSSRSRRSHEDRARRRPEVPAIRISGVQVDEVVPIAGADDCTWKIPLQPIDGSNLAIRSASRDPEGLSRRTRSRGTPVERWARTVARANQFPLPCHAGDRCERTGKCAGRAGARPASPPRRRAAPPETRHAEPSPVGDPRLRRPSTAAA